ncbi:MAG: DsbA family protein, partial [Holosporaceae bacterium]|nr:DsbA family protein [Holosporaceae bacterium]
EFILKLSIALIALVFSTQSVFGDNQPSQSSSQREEFFLEKLKKMEIPDELALTEVVIGDKNAPNTVIAYSSFSCSHCSVFHLKEFPKFKEKYVDTGKAKVYLRSYIDDPASLEAATLIRYFGGESNEKIAELTHKVFAKQKEWLTSKNPRKFLRDMFAEFGYDEKEIEKHIADTKIGAGLMKEQKRASEELKISLIPSFVVNGKTHQGKLSSDEIAEMF